MAFLFSFGGPNSWAEIQKIDTTRSQVGFEIMKYKIGEPVMGKFDRFSGSVTIKDGKMSDVSADIHVASINTKNEKRDNHLRSPDFFDVEKSANKIMKFRQGPPATIARNFKLRGNLTLKGVTRAVIMDVQQLGKNRFKARTQINKKDYGVTWNRPLEKSLWKRIKGAVGKTVIGEEVGVVLDIALKK